MSDEAQKVVVILDASRDVCLSSIRWFLKDSSLKSGDELTLFGVVHQVINPSTFGKLLGYKNKVDSSSIFGVNSRIVDGEVARKKDEYYKNVEIMELSQKCEEGKIKFCIGVQAGHSPKVVALRAAKNLKATWVILDRQMKKDKRYFLEKLSCKISRMKRDNTIELLRGPKETENTKLPTGKSTTDHVSYDEMIPALPGKKEEELSPKNSSNSQKTTSGKEQGGGDPPWDNYPKLSQLSKSSPNENIFTSTVSSVGNTEASGSSLTEAKNSPLRFRDEESTINTEQETAGEQSPSLSPESSTRERSDQMEARNITSSSRADEEQKQHISSDGDWIGGSTKLEDVFENSICSVCKNKRPKIGWRKDFTYAELHEATEGFSPKNFLSEGGFGCVYRGELKNGLKIAVKQHKDASSQGEKEFKTEVNVLRKARHENLVMLLGSCSEGSHRLLVYEYVCFGSLDQHLSKHTRRPLSWDRRIKIALGAAKALDYLHRNNIIHRDMRPNNILVTHDHESLLGDFGLARTQHEDSDHSSETSVVGTLGYLAPEYAESGKVSTKTDVYSFGVVLLQLITGLMTTDKMLEGKSLMAWARPLLKEKNYPGLIDKRIEDSHDVHQLLWMVRVAEKCLTKDPNKRIATAQVVDHLKYIKKGNTTGCIGDFSPAQSDSVNSMFVSPGSRDDVGKNEQENLSTEVSSISSTYQMSRSLSSSSATPTISMILSLSTSSGQSISSDCEKKRGTPLSRREVFYDEMII